VAVSTTGGSSSAVEDNITEEGAAVNISRTCWLATTVATDMWLKLELRESVAAVASILGSAFSAEEFDTQTSFGSAGWNKRERV
jgi:hypothetical protein